MVGRSGRVALAAAGVLLVGLAGFLAVQRGGGGPTGQASAAPPAAAAPTPRPPTPSPTLPPPTAAELQRVTVELTSGDPRRVAAVFAGVSPDSLPPATVTALAGAQQLTFTPGTFRDLGDGRTATIQVSAVLGGTPVTDTAVLVYEQGTWRIAAGLGATP